MEYIITESKLHQVIYNYLNETYPQLEWRYGFDDDANEDECKIVVYEGDFFDGETKFRVYYKCYWNYEETENAKLMWEKSPVLIFEKESELDALNNYFNDKWEPVFKKWFNDLTGLVIKTISY